MKSRRIGVVSDLHLFSTRSAANARISEIDKVAESCDLFFLNGDIFDFKWSVYGEETVEKAASWMKSFCGRHTTCKVIYIMGNHDALKSWADRCKVLEDEVGNFTFVLDYFRVDDVLITHGDLLLGECLVSTRTLVDGFPSFPTWVDRLYTLVCKLQLPRLALDVICRPRQCSRRLHKAMLGLPEHLVTGVGRLIVGHTHVPFTDCEVDGVLISNSGSTVHGMKLNLLEFSTNSEASRIDTKRNREELYEPA